MRTQRHKDAMSKYVAIHAASNTDNTSTLLRLFTSNKSKEASEIERNRAYIGTVISTTYFIVQNPGHLTVFMISITLLTKLNAHL